MPDSRQITHDLAALALLVLTVVLSVALATYHPADPPSQLVYPQHAQVQNACGPIGAFLAHNLFTGLGLGAYFAVASLGAVDLVMLSRRRITQPALRLSGWLLALAGGTLLAALLLPDWSPGPVIGSGGYLGAIGEGLLAMHFATIGSGILAGSLLAAGLFLCADDLLLPAAKVSARGASCTVRGAGHVITARQARIAAKQAAKMDDVADDEAEDEYWDGELDAEVEVEEAAEEEDDDLEVRIAGDAQSDEAPAETKKQKKGVAKRLASALKINGREERRAVLDQLDEAATNDEDVGDYELPPMSLLLEPEQYSLEEHKVEIRRRAKILERTFQSFGFNVKVVAIDTGPVIAQYEVELEAGLRLSKITSLADDIAIALRVPGVRIVAPIPGKNTVGIEVPNTDRQLVRLRDVIEEAGDRVHKMRIPLFLGKDVSGNSMMVDMTTLPHLLIAGRTGTGKSVCLNTMIMSMLMSRRPDEVKLLLIDPKMVELTPFSKLPHLMHPVVTDMKKAEAILAWAVDKMEERYALLARAGVRHVSVYNQLGEEELLQRMRPEDDEEAKSIPRQLPFIVIVADEMADLMMTAPKEVESHIIRLAQKSRAVGIHLILATQKPTVDVITGLIKSNLPARIAFQVASKTDSRVVLDESGAEKLLGNGDMLFLWPGTSMLLRGQGAYVADDEITRVVEHCGTTQPQFAQELVQLPATGSGDGPGLSRKQDDLYEAAVDIVVKEGRGSVSLLQRSLGIGYGRAARLIDYMAEDGLVGEYNGSQARDVLITPEQWAEMQGQQAAAPPVAAEKPAPPPRPPKNRILPEPEEDEEGPPWVDNEADDQVEEDDDEELSDQSDEAWDGEYEYEYEEVDEDADDYDESDEDEALEEWEKQPS